MKIVERTAAIEHRGRFRGIGGQRRASPEQTRVRVPSLTATLLEAERAFRGAVAEVKLRQLHAAQGVLGRALGVGARERGLRRAVALAVPSPVPETHARSHATPKRRKRI